MPSSAIDETGTDRLDATPRGRLRILVGLESSGPGGAENMVVSLAKGLLQRGHVPTISTDAPGWMTDRAAAAGVGLYISEQRRGVEWLWILKMAWEMRRKRIDLFHSHEFSMNIFGGVAAWIARVPHVATIHGRHYVTDAPRRVGAYRLLRRGGIPIVAVSEDLRGYLADGFRLRPDDLFRIHNGIELPPPPAHDPKTRKHEREAARRGLDLPLAGPLLVCVGNLYPVKDHATLVRALPAIPNARLAIAGRGDEEPNLRRLAADLGVADRLHLLGLRSDVAEILNAADVFVHPSRSEGLPLAVLEAMGHGLPVVASDVGGIPEAIDNEKTGRLVPSRDPAALAAAIAQILESPEISETLSQHARARVETEFSMDAMVERYLNLYRKAGNG